MKLFLHLGREQLLCAAEVAARISNETRAITPHILEIEVDNFDEALHLQDMLAGTVKISTPLLPHPFPSLDAWAKWLHENVRELWWEEKGRKDYGFSAGPGVGSKDARKQLDSIGIKLKKTVRAAFPGLPVRYVTSRDAELSSVQVEKEGLLPPGAEISFIANAEGIWASRTLTVQDWKTWQMLDAQRPGRDLRSGILPFKLAHMMINLAGSPEGKTLWDPFCGSGTVLIAALRLGYTHVRGSDVNASAIQNSKEGVAWYQDKIGSTGTVSIQQDDVSRPRIPHKADVIVTEPYMGTPWHTAPSADQAKRELEQLLPLYQAAIHTYHSALPIGGHVVMVLPSWKTISRVVAFDPATLFPSNKWKSVYPEPFTHEFPDHYIARKIVSYTKIG